MVQGILASSCSSSIRNKQSYHASQDSTSQLNLNAVGLGGSNIAVFLCTLWGILAFFMKSRVITTSNGRIGALSQFLQSKAKLPSNILRPFYAATSAFCPRRRSEALTPVIAVKSVCQGRCILTVRPPMILCRPKRPDSGEADLIVKATRSTFLPRGPL